MNFSQPEDMRLASTKRATFPLKCDDSNIEEPTIRRIDHKGVALPPM